MENVQKNTKRKQAKEQSRTTDKGRICCKLCIDGVMEFVYLESKENPIYFPTNYEKDQITAIKQGEWAKLHLHTIEAVPLTPELREKAVIAINDRKVFLANLKEVRGINIISSGGSTIGERLTL